MRGKGKKDWHLIWYFDGTTPIKYPNKGQPMPNILSDILDVDQHFSKLITDWNAYKPDQCIHCGAHGLWCHGTYARQSKCECEGAPSGLIPIPRFFCPNCQRTCSTLPAFIAPRRWYHWATQQIALLCVIMGSTLLGTWSSLFDRQPRGPSQATIQRWHQQFRHDYDKHRLHLCSQFPDLGRHAQFTDFWQACLTKMPLASAMAIVHRSDPSSQ